jgi:hypothetical protein
VSHPLGTITQLATGTVVGATRLATEVVTRTYGVTRGVVAAGAGLVRTATGRDADDTVAPQAAEDSPRPVNVTEELGLDPAPVERPREPRPVPVTEIDAQAEPGLVESTPADVAERISHSE